MKIDRGTGLEQSFLRMNPETSEYSDQPNKKPT